MGVASGPVEALTSLARSRPTDSGESGRLRAAVLAHTGASRCLYHARKLYCV